MHYEVDLTVAEAPVSPTEEAAGPIRRRGGMLRPMDNLVPEPIRPYLPLARSILIAVAILIGGWIASRWTHRLALRALTLRQLDKALGRFFASIVRYLVLAATVISAMEAVGVHTTSLVAILASAGLAVGLALQGSLGNFASGVMILFFRPFQLGDKVGISDKVGIVEDIGLFTTTLITANNEKLIIPNATVTGGIIVNFSDRNTLRGVLGVPIDGTIQDIERAAAALLKAAERTPGVSAEQRPDVSIAGMDAGGMELAVAVWYKANDEPQVMHALRRAIMEELAAAGLKMGKNPEVVVKR